MAYELSALGRDDDARELGAAWHARARVHGHVCHRGRLLRAFGWQPRVPGALLPALLLLEPEDAAVRRKLVELRTK